MLHATTIFLVSFGYLGLLFAIAYYADERADAGRTIIANPYIYSLSLGVYATAWTFYGSVGRAASDGIGFLPIYIGPTLMIALWWVVLRKILRISKQNRITSLADFVASRYGKSALLGGLVTIIAVIGILPYISLQLKAISNSFTILVQYPQIIMPDEAGVAPMREDTALWVALILAAFTIAFGTRHLDAAEHHQGLVAAIGKINAVERKPRTVYLSNIIGRDEHAGVPAFTADGRLLGICIGEQTLMATGELQDLLDQARQAAAKAAPPKAAPAGVPEGAKP
jgi:Na+/proline symporter